MLQPFKVLKIDAKLIIFSTSDSPYHRYAESSTPRLNDTQSRRLPDSTIRGIGDSPYQRYEESMTLRITDTVSFLLKNSLADSVCQWCGESSTPRIVESESRWLRISLIRRVADSPYRWVGESFFEYEYLREFEDKIGTARNVVRMFFHILQCGGHCLPFCNTFLSVVISGIK